MRRLTGPTFFEWLRLDARVAHSGEACAGDIREAWLQEARRLRHRIGEVALFNTDIHDNNLVFDVTDASIRAAAFREHKPSAAAQAQLLEAIAHGPGNAD